MVLKALYDSKFNFKDDERMFKPHIPDSHILNHLIIAASFVCKGSKASKGFHRMKPFFFLAIPKHFRRNPLLWALFQVNMISISLCICVQRLPMP